MVGADSRIEEQAAAEPRCLYCEKPIERSAIGRPRKFCPGRSCSQKYARRQKDPLVGTRRHPPLWRQLFSESLQGRPRVWGRKVDGDVTTFMAWNIATAAVRAMETGERFLYLPEHDTPAWRKVYALAGLPTFDSLAKGERTFSSSGVDLDDTKGEGMGSIEDLQTRVSRLEQLLWLQADETKESSRTLHSATPCAGSRAPMDGSASTATTGSSPRSRSARRAAWRSSARRRSSAVRPRASGARLLGLVRVAAIGAGHVRYGTKARPRHSTTPKEVDVSLTDSLDADIAPAVDVATAPGVTLKRYRGGVHGWEVHVPADGSSLEELRVAAEIAQTIDAELAEVYRVDEPEPDARKTTRATRASWGKEPATEKQLALIAKLASEQGLHIDPPTDKGQAATLIRKLLDRAEAAVA